VDGVGREVGHHFAESEPVVKLDGFRAWDR
jgi:hypothetical protein